MNAKFEAILAEAKATNASDIHIASDEVVAIRTMGSISFLENFGVFTKGDVLEIMQTLLDQGKFSQLLERKEHDFSYTPPNSLHYRCNAFYRKGALSLSMRCIRKEILTLDKIGVPEKMKQLLAKKQGLILISGPANSGKSTTMIAMLDWINSNRKDHIITIEDPIEYHLENKNCFISQRELHSDTGSFLDSLRAAMRQDPNIIAIGEIRDSESMEAVLRLCSTGHLVISTIHTSSSSQAIYRILNMFPHGKREVVLSQISDSLLAILNQRLVSTITDSGLVAIFELMIANDAIRNAVRNGDIAQIENTIATGMIDGMLTFRNHIKHLALVGKVDHAKALAVIE